MKTPNTTTHCNKLSKDSGKNEMFQNFRGDSTYIELIDITYNIFSENMKEQSEYYIISKPLEAKLKEYIEECNALRPLEATTKTMEEDSLISQSLDVKPKRLYM